MTDDVCVTTEIPLDNETRTALLLFNERLDARALAQRGKKRVAKAERAKEAAATNVRKLSENPNATAEEKAEAEAAYKAAVDEYNVIQADPTAGLDKPKAKQVKADTPAEEAASTEADAPETEASDSEAVEAEAADAAPLAEVSADEEEATAAPAAAAAGAASDDAE